MAEIALTDQIKAVESVVLLRRKTNGSMFALLGDALGEDSAAAVKNRIDTENAALEAAFSTLQRLEAWRTQPSPAAPGCKECDYHYYPSTNEDGWRCTSCGHRPGEPAGFSPELDRKRVFFKVGGILHDACDENLIYVSNGTGADLLISAVADRCVEEARFDQCSILLFLLEETTPSHAKYWGELSESILAGADPRDHCHCGALANIHSDGALYCSWEHMPAERAEMFAPADTNGGSDE